jgi:hypothetical protein
MGIASIPNTSKSEKNAMVSENNVVMRMKEKTPRGNFASRNSRLFHIAELLMRTRKRPHMVNPGWNGGKRGGMSTSIHEMVMLRITLNPVIRKTK